MLILDDIQYKYRMALTPALQGVSARIGTGIRLLVGENGAGKTTLLHVIAGLLRPDSGVCSRDGVDVRSGDIKDMGHIFFLAENMYFPAKSIRSFAKYHSPFYPNFSEEIFEDNLLAFNLTGNEKMRDMSLGNRKKAQLAYALALGVEVLLLDEPTNALDIQSKEKLRSMMASQVREDQTIIVSTHTISELETLFDGFIALSHGRLLLSADADDIAERLLFIKTSYPDPSALYFKPELGHFRSIFPADPGNTSSIDWQLLYNALLSPAGEQILKIFNDGK